jgi:hypothetical protein
MVNVFEPQVVDFDFMKKGQGDDVDKLAGATFQLFTDEAATTPLTDDESNTFEATSDADGKVCRGGPDPGPECRCGLLSDQAL